MHKVMRWAFFASSDINIRRLFYQSKPKIKSVCFPKFINDVCCLFVVQSWSNGIMSRLRAQGGCPFWIRKNIVENLLRYCDVMCALITNDRWYSCASRWRRYAKKIAIISLFQNRFTSSGSRHTVWLTNKMKVLHTILSNVTVLEWGGGGR